MRNNQRTCTTECATANSITRCARGSGNNNDNDDGSNNHNNSIHTKWREHRTRYTLITHTPIHTPCHTFNTLTQQSQSKSRWKAFVWHDTMDVFSPEMTSHQNKTHQELSVFFLL